MVFYVEKLPFKRTGTPNTECLLVWKDLIGSELKFIYIYIFLILQWNKDKSGLGSMERGQRALA